VATWLQKRWAGGKGAILMRRLPLVVALTATLLVAMALPVSAAPPVTDPIPAICGDENVALEFSLAPGSLVGWMVDGDGSELFVIHEIANPVTETIFFDEDQVATLEYPGDPPIQKGSQGLDDLVECTLAEGQELWDENLGPLTKSLAKRLSNFYPGIDMTLPEDFGRDVTSTGVVDGGGGTLWIQYPGSG